MERYSSSAPEAPKPLRTTIKESLRDTTGALILATSILAMSAMENKGYAAENNLKTPTVAAKSLKTEKKIPEIAEENPQIYEFLGGNITSKDTLASLQKKLDRKMQSVMNNQEWDQFLYYLMIEAEYRRKTGKEGKVLENFYGRMIAERKAIQSLYKFFKTLETERMEDMNDAIIVYYNQIDGDTLKPADVEQFKKDIAKEREELGYRYIDIENFIRKDEQRNNPKGTPKSRHM